MIYPMKEVPDPKIYSKFWRFLGTSIALLIIYFSFNPSYPLKQAITELPFGDQFIHLSAFGLLMYCFCLSLEKKIIQFILGFSLMILGIGLETLQVYLTGRRFEFEDGFANILGVAMGYLVSCFRK